MIDLVFAELESPWAMELIRGAESAAREAEASIVISVLHTHAGPGRDWLERLAARRTDGVIIVSSRLSPSSTASSTPARSPSWSSTPMASPPPTWPPWVPPTGRAA